CNYQGHIEGFPNSVVTISTCSGLRGLIQFENISYGIEPLETSSGFEHVIYPVKNKNALAEGQRSHHWETSFSRKSAKKKMQSDPYQSSPSGSEIHVVVEKNLYDHMGADPAAVTQKVFQVIGFVSAMFTSFNITLILSSLELWIDDNKISITGEANELLHRFLNWKKSYLVLRPHDVAFLLVLSYREKSRYVGATLKGKMCDGKNAGGVALYSRTISLESFAVIIAQLLSLSMGIAFDDVNKCQCSGAACIMNPEAVHSSGVRIFSNCSMEDFIRFISKPNSRCLQNQPHLDPSYKTSLCGNKHVEDGEQCDCGRVEECRRDPCCEYKTCRFKGNAVCAHGSCCTQCKLREKGEICRLSEDECDLTEYCNGSSNFCPENFYLHDGYRCNMNQWVCMEGKCRDGTRLCEEIYGKGTLYGSQACFEEINSRSDQFGNCGLSPGGFIPCTFNNLRCGKLMCIYTNKFPFSKEDAAVLYAGVEGDICISLYYPSRHKNYSHMWVPSGTICGDNKICMESMCVEDNLLPIECSSRKCNFQGRCNNRRNCHCEDRYLPPDCLTISNTWPGGSVDSGN
uniref:Disintegrin and metalloproteinase domain-containing protein 2 n=1 Tax=Loxodonta africana TaxID=9785 RepID=G3UK88_LOXAF